MVPRRPADVEYEDMAPPTASLPSSFYQRSLSDDPMGTQGANTKPTHAMPRNLRAVETGHSLLENLGQWIVWKRKVTVGAIRTGLRKTNSAVGLHNQNAFVGALVATTPDLCNGQSKGEG